MNIGCSELVSIGLVKIKGKFFLVEIKRLFIFAIFIIELFGKIVGLKECMGLFFCFIFYE